MARPIGVIQNAGPLINLLQSLGVNRPPTPFTLDGDVVPVVLVDSAISFVAAPTPPYRSTDIFTAGIVVAPAIGTVLADTLGLPVGSYSVMVNLYTAEAAGNRPAFDFQWRNAANTANLATVRMRTGVADAGAIHTFLVRLEIQNDQERFRVLTVIASNVGVDYQGTIFARI